MKKLIVSLIVAVLAVYAPLPAIGQGASDNANRRDFTPARGQLINARCTALLQRLDQASDSSASGQSRSANLTANLLARLTTFADRASEAGLDVEQLRLDLGELEGLSTQLSEAWGEFATALRNVAGGPGCDSSEFNPEAIHDAIEEAKTAKADVKEAMAAVIDFMQTTIRSDLADIKQQINNAGEN